jgi:hypothetical protein
VGGIPNGKVGSEEAVAVGRKAIFLCFQIKIWRKLFLKLEMYD